MDATWYQGSYRRNLVDMHINDSDPVYMSRYDPEEYVDNLIAAKVDTAILYAGNCLGICFWPTKEGHMHKNLHGRDFLGETIKACRHYGLHVNVYFNIWSRWAYDTHPEWRYLDAKGRGVYVESEGGRYGMCCSNSGFSDYVSRIVAELVANYDMDGFWVDMIGWFGGICFCDNCKTRYERDTGRTFPEKMDWRDAHWRDFQKHRESWHAEFAGMIRKTALSKKPGISVVFQSASWAAGWSIGLSEELYRQSDYLAGDFYGDPVEQSFVCKYLESMTMNKPVEFMSSRCQRLTEHTTTKQKELLEAQVYSSIANNASFVFIDAMDPIGTVDPAPYVTMGEIFSATMTYEPYLGPQLKRQADVAVYVDIHSLASMKDNGALAGQIGTEWPVAPVAGLLQIAKTLIWNNIPYDVATRKDLGRLGTFQVLILHDAFMLDKVEADAIRRFVANGGCLYASKYTSAILGNGDFLLTDVFGVSLQGETMENETYTSPLPGFTGLHPFTQDHPMTINDTQLLVNLSPGAEALATLTLPYTPPNDAYDYSSAISNPPGIRTVKPAIVRNHFGKGLCIYSTGTLERMPHDAHSRIFAGMIKSLLVNAVCYESDAPRSVEISVYDDPVANRLLISVLNFQKELPNIPVFGINVRVRIGEKEQHSLFELPGNVPVAYAAESEYVSFVVERLDTFAMYAMCYRTVTGCTNLPATECR
jgi:hypothetical protein